MDEPMFAVIFIPNFSLQSVLRHGAQSSSSARTDSQRAELELCAPPAALVDPALPKPHILQLTDAARARGVVEGLTASQAMARCGDLIIKPRSLVQEAAATEVLLQTAYAFSPNLE